MKQHGDHTKNQTYSSVSAGGVLGKRSRGADSVRKNVIRTNAEKEQFITEFYELGNVDGNDPMQIAVKEEIFRRSQLKESKFSQPLIRSINESILRFELPTFCTIRGFLSRCTQKDLPILREIVVDVGQPDAVFISQRVALMNKFNGLSKAQQVDVKDRISFNCQRLKKYTGACREALRDAEEI